MKRISLIIAMLVLAVFSAGCIRTTTVVKERVDQGPKGNRGYIQGNIPPPAKKGEASRMRTIMQVEIELPPYYGNRERKSDKTEDKKIWGNKGVVKGEGEVETDKNKNVK